MNMNEVIRVTFRLRGYLYEQIKLRAKRYNQSINDTMIELIKNGLLKDMETEVRVKNEYYQKETESNDGEV